MNFMRTIALIAFPLLLVGCCDGGDYREAARARQELRRDLRQARTNYRNDLRRAQEDFRRRANEARMELRRSIRRHRDYFWDFQ
jgi:hypothetical protein